MLEQALFRLESGDEVYGYNAVKSYEAFIAAGVPADKAKKASEDIADFARRRVMFDKRLIRLEIMVALILTGMISLVVRALFL